jgi:hypothetical protein
MPDSIKIAVLDDYQHNAESFANWSSLEPAARTVFFHDNVSNITWQRGSSRSLRWY